MSGYKPSYSGLGDLLRSQEMQAAMRAKAERIAEAARSIAPTGPSTDGTHYKDSFEVSSGVRDEGTRRAYGRVSNNSDHAAAIEFGNYRTRKQTIEAQHVLGRSIDAAKD